MTDNNHPITPPPELVEQWECEYHHSTLAPDLVVFISEKAARWGSDQELEACCSWADATGWCGAGDMLRDARRSKPPSLKKLAYDALDTYIYGEPNPKDKERTYNTIRRALEQLND